MCATSFYSRWRLLIKPLLVIVYALFVLIVLPWLIVRSVRDSFNSKDQLVLIGSLFVISALPISFFHIAQHLSHFTKPALQKHIVRILWMVPVYALNAWLGLLFPDHSIYMDSIRECYEAYVIYNFMKYLLNFLNLEMDLEANLRLKEPVRHIFPLCCLRPWNMGSEFVHNCKHGILQYTVVRPITTFISMVCEWNGVYGEGTFEANKAFPYLIAINNVSQIFAMYCLVLFYQANRAELKPMKPLPKFLCIKAVIFFSFFQGVIINLLVYFGFIKNVFGAEEGDDPALISSRLQDFLLCIEMFLAAIAHYYSFPHEPFHINLPNYDTRPNGAWYSAFFDMLDISDVGQDVSEHLGVVGSSLSRRLRGRTAYEMASGSEYESLVPAAAQSGYQRPIPVHLINAKNKYGAVEEAGGGGGVEKSPIDIIKNEERGPDQPTIGVAHPPGLYRSSGNLLSASTMTTDSSDDERPSTSDSRSATMAQQQQMKKSESQSSEWLSTPVDDFLGINVKGLEQDRINFKPDA